MVEKKIEKYYRAIGTIVVALIVSLILIFVLIVPSFKGIGKTNVELKARQGDLKILTQKLEKLKELKVKEKDIREQEKVVNGAIPTKKGVGDLFVQLEGLMAESGGSTNGINESGGASAGPSTSTPSVSSALTDASLVSSDYTYNVNFPNYDNFKVFLDASEKAHRFIHLNNFKVSKGQDNVFTVALSYKAYYRNQADSSSPGQSQATGGQTK